MSGRAPESPRHPSISPEALDPRVLSLVALEARLVRKYLARPQDTKVSVVMPTWNRAKVIGRAIDSVIAQRYRHFEVLVADDGSEDGTARTIEERYRNEPRVRYLAASHGGASRARNLALEHATGEIIAYLDTDNEWSANYLLVMVNSLLDDAERECIYCGARLVDDIAGESWTLLREYDRESLQERNYIDINVFVHRRSLYERHGGFDPDIRGVEDWELVLRYTEDGPPAVLPCMLTTYHLEHGLDHASRASDIMEHYRTVRDRYRRTSKEDGRDCSS